MRDFACALIFCTVTVTFFMLMRRLSLGIFPGAFPVSIARRQVDVGGVNQDLMYMSLKFINNIWVLVEFKVGPLELPLWG